MKIDIYRSAKNSTKYLSVPSGFDATTLVVPAGTDADILQLCPFRAELDIDPAKPRIALNAGDVIDKINKNGYAIHGATTKIEVKTQP